MKVIVELEIENCSECPHYRYDGEFWSESVYTCTRTGDSVDGDGIPPHCPLIESTMERFRLLAGK
jgi:hypothetical protein